MTARFPVSMLSNIATSFSKIVTLVPFKSIVAILMISAVMES